MIIEEKSKRVKKIVFSEKVDSKINGFAISVAFITVGTLLIYDNSYFGNEIVSIIIRWLFIIVGALGLSIELSKIGNGEIKGIGNFAVGSLFFAIWLALYLTVSIWFVNSIVFLFLIFGSYGMYKGLLEIIYSLRQLTKVKEKKSSVIADIMLLITTILGLILVVIQILQQLKVMPS